MSSSWLTTSRWPYDRPIGGLGIHLVRNIMDTMHYERNVDGYNVLTLTKSISRK